MKPRSLFQSGPVRVAVFLAAMALGAWQAARVADRLWPRQERREPGVGASPAAGQRKERRLQEPGWSWFAPLEARLAGSPHRTDARAGEEPREGSTPDGPDEPQTAEERAAAKDLADSMKRFVLSLEFNAGLPEPPQQVVVQPPAPWRPDPAAEGRAPPVIEDVDPRGGPASGGVKVTIRGRNLRASQVMFGLEPALIVSAGPSAVTVLAPESSAGPVTIAVTNDDGSYAVSGLLFTYGN